MVGGCGHHLRRRVEPSRCGARVDSSLCGPTGRRSVGIYYDLLLLQLLHLFLSNVLRWLPRVRMTK